MLQIMMPFFVAILCIFYLSTEQLVAENVQAVPTLRDPNLKVETVATGLDVPAAMSFIGTNAIIGLEKD